MPKMDGPVRDKAPCLGCPDREPGCHGKCVGYKHWRETVDKTNDARNKYRDRPLSRDERRERKIGQ